MHNDKNPTVEKKKLKRERSLERVCDKALLTTLKYRSVFRASLSYYQLCTFLITDKQITPKLLNNRLKNLVLAKKIREKKGKYYFPGANVYSWGLRANYSEAHYKTVQPTLDLLKTIKWIKLLAISGSTAAYNAKDKDDIDIFIITEKNRLWLTRGFVSLLLKATGKMRSDADFNDKICPNIYVDEDNLTWPLAKRNIYTAHEVLLMHPIINRENMYFKFLKKNDWVFDYFANFHTWLPERVVNKTKYESVFVDILEYFAMVFQLWYMRKKRTTEITTKTFIHFTKRDHTVEVLEEFAKIE